MTTPAKQSKPGSMPSKAPQQALPGRAGLKRKAAARREADALRLRAEADELDRQWSEYWAKEQAKKAKSA